MKRLGGILSGESFAAETKELHGAVGRLGKVVDKAFATDISAAIRPVEIDKDTLLRVIAEHLFQEGMFNVGETFVREARIQDGDAIRAPYIFVHSVIDELGNRQNLQPALNWVQKHQLAVSGAGNEPSNLEFKIHQLAFLQVLRGQGPGAALSYAREHLPKFQQSQISSIKHLIGSLCFARKVQAQGWILKGPYASTLREDILMSELLHDFARQSCALLGRPESSPLLVIAAAGAAALPTLLKLATVASNVQPAAELAGSSEELPVEVPLGREFVFHSIFACPVSREQSTPQNPAMLLPCGHCICKASILRIAKSANRPFKCPYCPVEARLQDCKELHFPDSQKNTPPVTMG